MPRPRLILAIDQGTTSTRAMVFDEWAARRPRRSGNCPRSIPPTAGSSTTRRRSGGRRLAVCRRCWHGGPRCDGHRHRQSARDHRHVGAGGQASRSTTPSSGRTGAAPISAAGWRPKARAVGPAACTGLLLDPYFSATKIAWLLDNVPEARNRAERGELAFGTIDSFLLWRLTGGEVHATDATNASRTLLFDIRRQDWDEELLDLLGIPRPLLPEVRDTAASYGTTEASSSANRCRSPGLSAISRRPPWARPVSAPA